MKFTSQIIAAGSGSIGGCVYSRNRSGPYIRNRSIPVNPGSDFQSAIRGAFATLVARWTEILTAQQRDSWDSYAIAVPVTDALGRSITLTGQNHYIRSNTARIEFGYAPIDDGPTVYDLGSFTNPSIVADSSAVTIAVTFDNTDAWADEDNAAMFIYAGRPFSASRNFFKGPYRAMVPIEGVTGTPPTSPQTKTAPFPMAAGNKVGFACRVSRADGRLSSMFRTIAVVQA